VSATSFVSVARSVADPLERSISVYIFLLLLLVFLFKILLLILFFFFVNHLLFCIDCFCFTGANIQTNEEVAIKLVSFIF
jgi:hypothetical protein